MSKFIQPVSMIFKHDDFIKDNLDQKLINLGYIFEDFDKNSEIIFTNYGGGHDIITTANSNHKNANDRYYINTYNSELFLALAAMTNYEPGIVGEWINIHNYGSQYTSHPAVLKYLNKVDEHNKLYTGLAKIIKNEIDSNEFGQSYITVLGTDNNIYVLNEFNQNNKYYRKATSNELIDHFTMKKNDDEIIGYKLIKPQYEKQAADIGAITKGLSRFDEKDNGYYKLGYLSFESWSMTIQNLKEAGVLDLWFEPVYKQKEFKVSDFIYDPEYNDVINIVEIIDDNLYFNECNKSNYRIKHDKMRIATQDEINNLCYVYFRLNDNSYVSVKNNNVYHGTDNITNFVLELGKFWSNIPSKFSAYIAKLDIDSVVFLETGCVTYTTLSNWLEIYKFIYKADNIMNYITKS